MATRLQKIMAHLGWGSRRHCEDLIRQQRVTLDGQVLTVGTSVSEDEASRLMVDGQPAGRLPAKRYLLLNKPAGFVTTVSDPQGRETVMALLPPNSVVGEGRLYPVGRLDRDTEGALLFTNDGELVHRLLHPSSGVEKEYRATVAQTVGEEALAKLRLGPTLDDGPSQPPKSVSGRGKEVRMILKEGRKHQVRRMLKAVGLHCLYLERRRFANLTLTGLQRGQVRELSADEIAVLQQLAEGPC
jgi:23S rRNA pseudouridine2605 synthase